MSLSSASTLTVAVLAGGRSSEHDISLSSASSVREGLEQGGHGVVWVEIDEHGAWQRDGERLSLVPGEGLLGADVVFPVLHGPFGEDGTVQGLLETLDVAYVGAGVAASAVCMNKVLFKQLMQASGEIPQVQYAGVREERFRRAEGETLAELARLGLPVFVKPAHLGSSVGIAKVIRAEQLLPALEDAFAHDELAIVEEMAAGVEVECGVLGCPRSERDASGVAAIASEPGQIVLSGEWYDFRAKYEPGGMELHVPAQISERARSRVRALALRAFELAGCDGLARADFFVDGEHVLLNELNTIPGFTPTSVYAKLLSHSGIEYSELVERLCRLALERHASRRARRH